MKAKTLLDAMHCNDMQTFKTLLPSAETKQRSEALMFAAGLGKSQYVPLLLPVKSSVKREALRQAVCKGHLNCAMMLLPQRMVDSGALCCAVRHNRPEIFDFLLSFAPLPSHQFMALRACLNEKSQFLHYFSMFERVLAEAVQRCPEQLREDFHFVVSEAIVKKDTSALEVLCDHEMFKGFRSVDVHSAVKTTDRELVRKILPHVEPDSCSDGLVAATRNGDMEMVQLLLEKADPRANTSVALQHACVLKKTDIFNLLYPLSDPHVALHELQKRYTDIHWKRLEERIQEDLRNSLKNETASKFVRSPSFQRKM